MEAIKNSVLSSLNKIGIKDIKKLIYNPSFELLYSRELDNNLEGFSKGQLTELSAVNVMTGKFTGRSPKDKYIVEDEITKDTIWWTSDKAKNDNKPLSQEIWTDLKNNVLN